MREPKRGPWTSVVAVAARLPCAAMGDVVRLGRSQRPPVTTIGEPMLTEHNARLEFDRTDIDDFGDELIETLKAYHPRPCRCRCSAARRPT